VQKARLNLSSGTLAFPSNWRKQLKNSRPGLLVDLHDERGPGEEAGSAGGGGRCGQINVEAVQQVLAAKWAVDVINNQSLPHELSIGEYRYHIER
jgi:hypothetical protein